VPAAGFNVSLTITGDGRRPHRARIVLSFHALPRYRLPLDPLLIILASGPLDRARRSEPKIATRSAPALG
jgi:hypothetical protein